MYIGLFSLIIPLRAGGPAHWDPHSRRAALRWSCSSPSETCAIVSASRRRIFGQAEVQRSEAFPWQERPPCISLHALHHHRLRAAARRAQAIRLLGAFVRQGDVPRARQGP